MKKVILTGDRPTGRLHIGHYIGSLVNRVKLQDEYKQYVMIADIQALTDNFDNPQKVRDNIIEVALDYLAVGIDPKKSTIFIQSLLPELSELTMYFLNLVTLSRLKNNPTVKEEMKQKNFGASIPVGFLVYPISQVADILGFKADVIPVGEDQLPMIEQTNEIVDKFNRIYSPVFKRVSPLISKFPRLKGIDGNSKMGKSLNNAIYLSSSHEEIRDKVMAMYTDPNHIHKEDPGKVEGNMVFYYLDAFDTGKDTIEQLKARYRKGGLGDIELKERLITVLDNLIKPIRERREEFSKDKDAIYEMLKRGSEEARVITEKTLAEVKKSIKINYYE